MNLKRNGALLGVVAAGALTLAACGTDNNAGSVDVDASASAAACDGKSNLSGAGSSAQKNAMDQFVSTYIAVCSEKGTNVNVAYNPTGSGDGRTQFIANQIDFAGSDSAIKDEQAAQAAERCAGNPAWNLPLVFGPVALAYNVEGVDELVLDAETAAKIFNGSITKWNDPAIAALNEGAELPDANITPIVRSDSSGTTDNFQQYLETASNGAWTSGAGSDFTGGVGEGAKGSAGVAQAVSGSPNSITYVEKSFADQNGLSIAQIDNGSGPVELTEETAGKAIEGAEFVPASEGDLTLDLSSIFGSSEEGAYPLVLATYEIVCSAGYDADTAAAVKSFLISAANEGQEGLSEQGYVPLPDAFKTRLTESIDAIAAG
ncbi:MULTISPECIES: phosphate ABC transporter substrate-binding protein PstS [Rhodococcus]|uniref:Phosphate-binding protein n=2 Tax=Rhodococcus TaxID=1827 RepID=A0A6I6XS61_RHORH|nr:MULTISPECIES: phosphate ABC transporter substrate-binding protein PstS [Rhodococcus]MCR8692573.1 phosphate ABC transporter substrate-binding protein PstS [Rhodococcus pyridinivorans]KSZ58426.1 phosphate-binding protein [Rhodococcus pyridinivorans KG-16]MBF4477815.1 phosphate ABC transporter substrate-binding protein PstS [Rhodococcus rhodochrous]MCB8909582.1 phosphate ABC transporter substrate-binding protein PstS [Rhodococcus rhodochrous]MCD2110262.1 phosphate ABC transporter substrate-bin